MKEPKESTAAVRIGSIRNACGKIERWVKTGTRASGKSAVKSGSNTFPVSEGTVSRDHRLRMTKRTNKQ
jgi:hypothetical protein